MPDLPLPPVNFYCADTLRPETSVGFLIKRVMQSVLLQIDRRLLAHDLTHAPLLHDELLPGDRGFASYVHLAQLFLRELHGLLRGHQRQIVHFRAGRRHTQQHKPSVGVPRTRWLKRLGGYD